MGEDDLGLSDRQGELLEEWLPGYRLVANHGWGLVATYVLEVEHGGRRYIAKAGGPSDHHIARELRAHRCWLRPWTSQGLAPELVHGDVEAKLLLTRYLPGQLVQGSAHESTPATYRQAGALLAKLHGQLQVVDDDFERRQRDKALGWLDKQHRIAPDVETRLRNEVESWPTPGSVLVPTHGDWQPRNWLVHNDVVRAIDFGRADLRPAMTDLARLSAGQFRNDSAIEAAFLAGYGSDPREPAAWHRNGVREAIGTAVWAHQVGDEGFEAQGHRMIAEVLHLPSSSA